MAGYTFDHFIVGNSNRFAHAAASAVAENPGKTYNPLFIYGNSGLGKTHLLLAIGNAIHERWPNKTIVYIKGDEFTNQLVRAIKSGTTEDFRNKYRSVDLFLVDDIQFIAGKQQTQNEFFHTFNSIYEAGNQIVITSDRPPLEMATLDDRLRTRFEWGLMADIQPPDLETRMAITRNKAAQLGLILSDEAVTYIAENITSNIRRLEGVIKKLTAYKEILNEVITIDSVKRAIRDVIIEGIYTPTPEIIIRETARYFQLTEEDLRRPEPLEEHRHGPPDLHVSDALAHRPDAQRDRRPVRGPQPRHRAELHPQGRGPAQDRSQGGHRHPRHHLQHQLQLSATPPLSTFGCGKVENGLWKRKSPFCCGKAVAQMREPVGQNRPPAGPSRDFSTNKLPTNTVTKKIKISFL